MDLASFFVSATVKYLDNNGITGNNETDRYAWIRASYKVTYDSTDSLEVDWAEEAKNIGLDLDVGEVSDQDSDSEGAELEDPQVNKIPALEKRHSFPWIFKDYGLLAEANT